MEPDKRKVILIITDITGYTRFMITNKTSLVHSQIILTELTKAIIKQVEIPLTISKLEGDAIFCYALKDDGESSWQEAKKKIGEKLIKFSEVFSEKIKELNESNICDCNACRNVNKLKLKTVVHSGEAVIYQIDKFYELSGLDVIIVHKLLKNSVKSDQYILMTEQARNDVELSEKLNVINGEEQYGEIGKIKTCVYLLDGDEKNIARSNGEHNYSSTGFKMKNAIQKMFKSMLIKFYFKKLPQFNNLPCGYDK